MNIRLISEIMKFLGRLYQLRIRGIEGISQQEQILNCKRQEKIFISRDQQACLALKITITTSINKSTNNKQKAQSFTIIPIRVN
jgi:hypothetical protein